MWGRQPPRYPCHTIRIVRPDPWISRKDRPHPPTTKKIGRPLPLTLRFAQKSIGPTNFRIGRGDHFFSIALPCVSRGIQAREDDRSDHFCNRSVRQIPELVGATIDPRGSEAAPTPPAAHSAEKPVGPIDSKTGRIDRLGTQEKTCQEKRKRAGAEDLNHSREWSGIRGILHRSDPLRTRHTMSRFSRPGPVL